MPVSSALMIAAALVAVTVVIGFALRMLDGRRRAGADLRVRAEDVPLALAPGVTLVQFSTELCARCPHVRRMLNEIAGSHPGVEHIEIDLTNRGDLAARYRVLQTPTTFLVTASGAVLSRWGGVPSRATIDQALGSVLTPHPQEHR